MGVQSVYPGIRAAQGALATRGQRRLARGTALHVALSSPQHQTATYGDVDLVDAVATWDEENQRELVFLTNHLELAANTVAAIYKERWQIELLFKALKQNLRVKTFVGTTANALKTQIWTALIALLAIYFLQLQAKFTWSLSRLIALLRQQLFVYRDLWRWLESPFEPPQPLTEEDTPQLPFAWTR